MSQESEPISHEWRDRIDRVMDSFPFARLAAYMAKNNHLLLNDDEETHKNAKPPTEYALRREGRRLMTAAVRDPQPWSSEFRGSLEAIKCPNGIRLFYPLVSGECYFTPHQPPKEASPQEG